MYEMSLNSGSKKSASMRSPQRVRGCLGANCFHRGLGKQVGGCQAYGHIR